MFTKLHLLSQDVPEGGGGLSWRKHPYLCMVGGELKGPAVFDWSERQRKDLEALWRDPSADGPRVRLGGDLATFGGKLGWTPEVAELERAEASGEEYMVTISAGPPELYVLPWEVTHVGAGRTHLSSFASAQVRYAVPGLEAREVEPAPPRPGVLFAWSDAGGGVPHEDQGAAIRKAARAGGVELEEIAGVDAGKLQAALDAGPPSVLHLLCHGLPGPAGEPPRLVWGADLDHRSEITATALAEMLRRHHDAIRLVVLSACGSGDGRGDPLFMSSIAQELHRKGIPNVVASRYPLSVRGSRVLTRALYGKMLDEAWSMERALRHARQELFRVDEEGESHAADAYGLQLYACDTERFRSDNDVEAERPVLASYPFGTAARPVPAKDPPAAELTLEMENKPELSAGEVAAKLRQVSEDDRLTIAIQTGKGRGAVSLVVHTTVDGAQRLLGARRSKVLQIILGVAIIQLILTKGAKLAGAATLHAAQHGTGGGSAGQGAGTAGQGAGAAEQGGAASKAAGAIGRTGLKGLRSVALRAAGAKLAAIVVGGAAAVGGVTVYRSQNEASAKPVILSDAGMDAPGEGTGAGSSGGLPSSGSVPSSRGEPPRQTTEPSTTSEPATHPVPAPVRAPTRTAPSSSTQGNGPGSASHTPAKRAPPPVSPPPPPPPPARGQGPDKPDSPAAGSADPGDPADQEQTAHERSPDDGPPVSDPARDPSSKGGDGPPGHARGTEVDPTVLQASFQSGDRAPLPDPETIRMMRHDHARSIEGEVRLCTTSQGDVATAWVSQSTGYPRYDEILRAAVRQWHYRPRTANGTDVPMCSSAHFKYSTD